MTVAQYIKKRDSYKNIPGVIREGVMYVIVNGKEIPESKYPKPKFPSRLWTNDSNPSKVNAALN